jgi:hypothetical protein
MIHNHVEPGGEAAVQSAGPRNLVQPVPSQASNNHQIGRVSYDSGKCPYIRVIYDSDRWVDAARKEADQIAVKYLYPVAKCMVDVGGDLFALVAVELISTRVRMHC